MNNTTPGRGRGLRSYNSPNNSLNVNASEYQPSTALLSKISLKENGDRVSDYSQFLRSCVLAVVADNSTFSVRVAQLVNSLQHSTDEVISQVFITLITMAEEDHNRADVLSRITNSLLARWSSPAAATLEHLIMQRANHWRTNSQPTASQDTLGFTCYVAALYTIFAPRQPVLGCVLCALLDVLICAGGPVVDSALTLVEVNVAALVEDWKHQGEKPDSELEHLMSLVRSLLVRWAGGIPCLTPTSAAAALAALERRAGELARLRVFENLEMSRQVSEETDDVYGDYEKFLIETGQI